MPEPLDPRGIPSDPLMRLDVHLRARIAEVDSDARGAFDRLSKRLDRIEEALSGLAGGSDPTVKAGSSAFLVVAPEPDDPDPSTFECEWCGKDFPLEEQSAREFVCRYCDAEADDGAERCPGCGCRAGDGRSPGCAHPDGCGYQMSEDERTLAREVARQQDHWQPTPDTSSREASEACRVLLTLAFWLAEEAMRRGRPGQVIAFGRLWLALLWVRDMLDDPRGARLLDPPREADRPEREAYEAGILTGSLSEILTHLYG
jgi:hypothetical protein